MTIGQTARRCGLTPRAIRYYERAGLVPRPLRTAGNYRVYDEEALERLRFVARCRSLGFTLSETRALCLMRSTDTRRSPDLIGLIREHLELTERKLREVLELRRILLGKPRRRRARHAPGSPPARGSWPALRPLARELQVRRARRGRSKARISWSSVVSCGCSLHLPRAREPEGRYDQPLRER
ncbi:MAG: MerR family transcriptional regulator [Gammaproteobacteria bacterium]|nr:MerR family transcriptional regulator [Gammaproteobacteria bacterium]NIR85974.1 MerR family transcriptional regulator [Gammaproteobacteria bacterium]NIR91965.1 MerR family transcriptional regulator [Gammaproteobacteria bacterium]NIU07215.1 MerR family transcriptional regulator [Gammaproteobacteria bacterium]NIV74216.1 MerR family transcriptional regulator [Gammaproteobacteria bacterium]